MTNKDFFELLRSNFLDSKSDIEAIIDNAIVNRINDIEKELKALEIIKRVYTDLCFILSFDTFEEYDNTCNLINVSVKLKYVNKEEFELLKEVFK